MHKYCIYIQWSRLPEPTGTKTSHVSFISFDIFKFTPLDTLTLGDHAADAGTFLKGNILLQVKRDPLGK